MNLFFDYISPDYVLTEVDNDSGGSITAGNTVDYVFEGDPQRVIREGTVRIEPNMLVSGSVNVKIELYLGNPQNGVILYNGESRPFAEGQHFPVWQGDIYASHALDDGLSLRVTVTETSTSSAVTFGRSIFTSDIRSGSNESVDAFTKEEFTLILKREYFFGYTQTDVKEYIEIPAFSKTTSKELVEIGGYTQTYLQEYLEIAGLTQTDIHIPDFTNYISDLKMGMGEEEYVLQDKLKVVRSGHWLADQYAKNYPSIIPPDNVLAPETWRMKEDVADSVVRITNAHFVDQGNMYLEDAPGEQLHLYFPDNTYMGNHVYRQGQWQLPYNYEGRYTVHFPLYLDEQNYRPKALWFMIRHEEDDAYLSAMLETYHGEKVLSYNVSSTEIAEVFYWENVKVPITVVLEIQNFVGSTPGFKGTSASMFYVR